MEWATIERPGVFGHKKSQIFSDYDSSFGKGNWRIVHAYQGKFIPFRKVCSLFEQAYFQDSVRRDNLWNDLRKAASEVYDIDPSDINSGLDYLVQNNTSTHIQDIAIRNVFRRNGWNFQGSELIQIRGNAKPFGQKLTPGRVEFHQPQDIVIPHLEGWWDKDSVEDFYQSNKVLHIKGQSKL
jgi:hypothetical protein